MVSHEIDYKIFGNDIQFVEIELNPGETVIAEAGTMIYMEQGISFDVKMGDGSTPDQGLMSFRKTVFFVLPLVQSSQLHLIKK